MIYLIRKLIPIYKEERIIIQKQSRDEILYRSIALGRAAKSHGVSQGKCNGGICGDKWRPCRDRLRRSNSSWCRRDKQGGSKTNNQ